ncbi:MAG TPA: DUF4908 domain-containing protein [Rhizomicrobium sp.]|nr:DUF4908 domain-containing protein [Rhizomicrobium sp.]
MARVIIAFAALFAACAFAPAYAQDFLEGKLNRLGAISSGDYLAGDSVRFSIAGGPMDTMLLRFDGDAEVFVLYTGHASLGGRVLKYDSGETALQVSGWGGMTLYTDAQPNGLPVVRTGDAFAPSPPNVSLSDMQNAAEDEAQHLAYMRGLRLSFTADWNALQADATTRAFAFDTLENAVRGLDRYSTTPAGREALAHHLDGVMVEPSSGKPVLRLNARTLVVTFNPAQGYLGRASSRAIARALGALLPRK